MLPPIRSILRLLLLGVMVSWAGLHPIPADADAPAKLICPLGATPQEIKTQYGPVLRHNARVRHHQVLEGGTILDGDLHGKNGLVVRVVYHQNQAVLLEFTRVTGTLTAEDVNALLATCAAASSWEIGKDSTDVAKFYHRADGKAIAHWSTTDDGSLLIAAEADSQSGNLTDRLLP